MIRWFLAVFNLIGIINWIKGLVNECRIRLDERAKINSKAKEKTDADRKKGTDAVANITSSARKRLLDRHGRTRTDK